MGKPARTLARAGMFVAPASILANLLGYAFNLTASRGLGPADYGAVAALLGLLMVGLVPALALQTVVARHTALYAARRAVEDGGAGPGPTAGPRPAADLSRTLLTTAATGSALVAAGAALLAPAVTAFLHLHSPWPFLWMALSLAPLTMTAAAAGVLQGGERFGRLAAVMVLPPTARFAGGLAALTGGAGVTGVMAGITLASFGALAVTLLLLRPELRTPRAAERVRTTREVVRASQALLGLLVLANLDLVLARHHLSAHDAGLYAAGSLVAKAAFWLPQFVPMIVFARLTDAERGPAVLRRAVAAVVAMGAATVLVVAVAGTPMIRLLLGADYAEVGPLAWAFALLGTALALVQLLLYSDIAASAGRLGVAVWVAVLAEVVLITVAAHGSAGQIVAGALLGPVGLLALGAVRRRRPVAADEHLEPVLAGPTGG
jgi:O-antigen/teichoic acid export membrane protein